MTQMPNRSSKSRTFASRMLPLTLLLVACGPALEDELDLEEQSSVNSAAASKNFVDPRSKPFVSGKNGYPYYRTPSITKAANGDLLVFAEGRDRREDDCTSDIVLRRSTDNGVTWKDLQVVAGKSSKDRFAYPVPVVLDDGSITILYNRSRFVKNEEDRGCRQVFMKTSTDHGRSWSTAQNITNQTQRPCQEDGKGRYVRPKDPSYWGWTGLGPGQGIVKKHAPNKGRILFCARRKGVGGSRSYVIYSDNNGSSWQFADTMNRKSNECTLVELPNGNIMLNARDGSQPFRVVAVSANAGKSFGPAWLEDQLPEPVSGCAASLLRYGSSILFSNPNSDDKRTRGTLRRSTDNGITWTKSRQYIKNGEYSSYSDLVRVKGDIGVLVEWGPSLKSSDKHKEIRFIVVPKEDLGL